MNQGPILAANWKCNLDLSQVRQFGDWIKSAHLPPQGKVILFASHCFLPELISLQSDRLMVGAQDVSTVDRGAFTGEVAAFQLKSLGVEMVLVGHSERRHVFGETDEQIASKLDQLLQQGLAPCFCFGETLAQRKAGKTLEVIYVQLQTFFDAYQKTDKASAFAKHAILAYEPVWAIGTGVTAQLEDIREVHERVASLVSEKLKCTLPILYGGSVKPSNTYDIIGTPNVDGVLVGGASNQPETFGEILQESSRR